MFIKIFSLFVSVFFYDNMRQKGSASKMLTCNSCGKNYTYTSCLYRHIKYECEKNPRFKCPYCTYIAKRQSNVYAHIKNMHKNYEIWVIDTECPT